MGKRRNPTLSYLNLLFCILVVFIHTTSEPVTAYPSGTLPYFAVMIPWRLSSFVVQGFLFLSGVKLCLDGKDTLRAPSFWWRRFRGVVIPYLLWNLLYYCYFVHNGYFPFRLSDLVGYTLRGDLVSPFYFVILIVQFYLLAPLFVRLTAKCRSIPLLAGSFVIMLVCWKGTAPLLRAFNIGPFPYMDRVFVTYLFYFVLGCVAGRHYERFCAVLKKHTVALGIAAALLAVGDIVMYAVLLPVVGGDVADVYHVLWCTVAILFAFALCRRVKRPMPRFLALADKATYPVFLVHCLPIFWINEKMTFLGIQSTALRYGIRMLFVYTVSFGLCILWQLTREHFWKRKNQEKTQRSNV